MGDSEKKKIITNKSRSYPRGAASNSRTFSSRGHYTSTKPKETVSHDIKQPTILLKNKDHAEESAKKSLKVEATTSVASGSSKEAESKAAKPSLKRMPRALKFIDDGNIYIDHLQEYLQENSDFVVVGVVGPQGVGKSTILNWLAENGGTHSVKDSYYLLNQNSENAQSKDKNIFKIESKEDIENCLNTTCGIDIYVTQNRIIFLDCQPILSVAILDELIESENKRSNLLGDFIPLENSGEIQGLQYTTFLMSVCHILLVVQDWFFDSNVVRFIQTAEMLKPTISNPEDEYCEHYPHLIMIHNRAQMADFTPKQFQIIQKVYDALFQKTKMQFQSNLGLGSGRIVKHLDADNCGNPVNVFLLPEIDLETDNEIYKGRPSLRDLLKRLEANLYGASKSSLTHVQLTEKTWLLYCNKVWETVKKSPFFVEYNKLMP